VIEPRACTQGSILLEVAAPKKKVPTAAKAQPPELFWQRHQGQIVAGFAAAIALAIVTAFVGVFTGFFNNIIDSRVQAKLAPLEQRIDRLQSDVSEINGELKRIAAATPESSPSIVVAQLRSELEEAKRNPSDAGRKLRSIQARLLTANSDTDGYWPLVFSVITERSILVTGMKAPPKPRVNVFENMRSTGSRELIHGGYIELRGTIGEGNIVDSWVEFDASHPVRLINVRFIHCVLVFRGFGSFNIQSPPPAIRKLGRELLAAADLNDVRISDD
jgi:hypothetical protein